MIKPEKRSSNPVSKGGHKSAGADQDLNDWLDILSGSKQLDIRMSDATRAELLEGLNLAEAAIRRALAERKTPH